MKTERCLGPTAEGGCPRAADDGTVYCAGRTVRLRQLDGSTVTWTVEPGAQACFLAVSGLLLTPQPLSQAS